MERVKIDIFNALDVFKDKSWQAAISTCASNTQIMDAINKHVAPLFETQAMIIKETILFFAEHLDCWDCPIPCDDANKMKSCVNHIANAIVERAESGKPLTEKGGE